MPHAAAASMLHPRRLNGHTVGTRLHGQCNKLPPPTQSHVKYMLESYKRPAAKGESEGRAYQAL